MTSISETVGQQSQLTSALRAGLDAIDRDQTVVFTQYTKTILPADGYVFWVATANTVTVSGSVHYGVDKEQNEDETIAINRVIFTAESQIQQFSNVSPSTIYIGTFDGLQFAFSQQGDFYQQADLWHYIGNAVYPAMASQLVSSAAGLAALEPIVSNSLPLWLGWTQFGPVYPSFLVPDNLVPPYIVAHIGEDDTTSLQPLPVYTAASSSALVDSSGAVITDQYGNPILTYLTFYPTASQLMQDKVRLTLYGFNNQQALSYRDYLFNQSLMTDSFGLCGPEYALRDAKRTQREIGVIAQKKTLDLNVSYYQSTVSTIAQNLIASVSETFTVGTST